jgi:hypothetical protein
MNMPCSLYEIRIAGHLDTAAAATFADLSIAASGGTTVLRGEFGQAGLHALLDRVRALGLELVDIQRAPDPPAAEPGKGDAAGLPPRQSAGC